MRLVFSFSLTSFFTFFFLTVLSAQGPWAPTPVPEGDYVEDEFIIYFDPDPSGDGIPNSTDELTGDFKNDHGLIVEAVQLDQAGSYYLIRLIKTTNETVPSGKFCNLSAPYPLDCNLCDVLSNPGGGGPMGRGDDLAPDYFGDHGLEDGLDPFTAYSYNHLFRGGEYNPLVGPPSELENEEEETGRIDCYGDATLPFSTEQQRSQLQVAILDSGIATENYEDFFEYQENGEDQTIVDWVPIPENILDADVVQEDTDPNGHGTAVGFLVAHEFVNQQNHDGIQLNSYQMLNHEGVGTLASLIWSLDHAINSDVDIINMSFGFRASDCYQEATQDAATILKPLFSAAEVQEILIFTSAGNDDSDLGVHPQWPAAFSSLENVFTVGADGCTPGIRWPHSNFNSDYVDMMAPGVMIAMPYTRTVTPGEYILASGTSFATPLVASVAASYLSSSDFSATICALKGEVTNASSDETVTVDSRFGSVFDVQAQRCLNAAENGGIRHDDATYSDSYSTPTVFPNPFNEELTVRTVVKDGMRSRIRIIDSSGRLTAEYTSTSERSTINTASIISGVYFLEVVDANGHGVRRLVKK